MDPTKRSALLADLATKRATYVERVGAWRDAAGEGEDIVQDAFARAAASARALRNEARGEEWFFRALQSAYVDRRRRSDARRRMLAEVTNELIVARQATAEPPELSCACLHRGLSALRPEYRKALEAVELG